MGTLFQVWLHEWMGNVQVWLREWMDTLNSRCDCMNEWTISQFQVWLHERMNASCIPGVSALINGHSIPGTTARMNGHSVEYRCDCMNEWTLFLFHVWLHERMATLSIPGVIAWMNVQSPGVTAWMGGQYPASCWTLKSAGGKRGLLNL